MRKIFLLLSFAFFATSLNTAYCGTAYHKMDGFVDKSGVEWEQSGDFSVLIFEHEDVILQRSTMLSPLRGSPIERIFIGAYEDGKIKIYFHLKKGHKTIKDIEKDLSKRNLKYPQKYPFNIFWIKEGVELRDFETIREFLMVFVENEILSPDMEDKIISIIDVEEDKYSRMVYDTTKRVRKENRVRDRELKEDC